MTRGWKTHSERSTPLALKMIRWIALNLGRRAARLILYPIALYFFLFAPSQRRASRNYLRRVLNRQPTNFDIAQHIHCFASTILDRVYFMTGKFDQFNIQFPPENLPLRYSNNGIGSILLGSHIGSFDALRCYAVDKCPLPIKILMHEAQNPMIMGILNALNPKLLNMVIPLGEPESLLQVKEAVDAGTAVGMLGDRLMDEKKEKTAQCILLGGQITLPTAPVIIAAALNVPIIVFFGIYEGGNRYRLEFELLAEKIEIDRRHRQRDIQMWTQRYVNILETRLLSDPYNWFNFYDYWEEEQSPTA